MSRLRNDLYCVEWDVKLYYTIPYYAMSRQLSLTNEQGRKYKLNTILEGN